MAASASKGRSWTGIGVLLIFFAFAIWLLVAVGNANQRETVAMETYPNPSVENSRGSGSKGFYDWVQVLGYKSKTWSKGYTGLPSDASILVVIAPNTSHGNVLDRLSSAESGATEVDSNPMTAADGISVRNWIASGHTLLIFASSLPGSTVSAFHASSKGGSSANPSTFSEAIGVYPQSAIQNDDEHTDYVPAQPSDWTLGVQTIHIHHGYRLFDPVQHGQVLFADIAQGNTRVHEYPVAEVYTIGKGRVVAVSDDMFVCNRNIIRADNATFMYRVLTMCAHKGDTILFDEYHHIVGIQSPSLWIALGKPTQYATLQLGAVLLIALIILLPRLGQPVPLTGVTGRTSAEYVTSLAGLYQSAGVTTTALETIYRQFLRELCQKFGLPIDSTLDRMAEVAARRGGASLDGLRKLLVACEKALSSQVAVNGRDLVLLVRAIERYRKELGIG